MQWIEGGAFAAGLVLAGLLLIFPRFGAGSRHLILLILPAAFSAAIQAFAENTALLSAQDSLRLAYGLILPAAAGGYVAGCRLNQQARRAYELPALITATLLFALLYLVTPPYAQGLQTPDGYIALGAAGYLSALYLLIIAVVSLAKLEQMLRRVSETVRWELKHLFLGMGIFFAAVIYMSSQVLLYPPRSGLLSAGAMTLLHLMLLISCGFIFISWKRGSGRSRIAVSHGAIYSSITLLSVGVYLIASSLIARWASRYGEVGLPIEALIFLLTAIALAAVLLTTAFRHRARDWIRRNIFSGRYDYRRFWLEATERIRSIDPPETTAAALADIIHRALGAIDVSVWARRWNPNQLRLLSATGSITDSIEKEVSGVVEQMLGITEPVSLEDLENKGEVGTVRKFVESTRASLLVPLLSSNRIVGLVSVGADRSGRPYDQEAREFLRVLAGHAAGEFHKSDLLAAVLQAKEDEAFRSFSTFVLHDLKNFASTLSYIAQNAPRHRENPEFQKDAFQSVFDTAEKIKRLCNSLRTFSGALAANKRPMDINQIVRSVADNFNAGFSEHLRLELGALHHPVTADPEEVERVLQNLLLNAREAIAENGIVTVRTADRGERIEISVEDNGRGMSREFMEKELFLPFHTTKSGGLGIGLFQSKKIMEAHGGAILVESEEGRGTTVRLMFPKS